MLEKLNLISECFKHFPFIQEGWLFGSYAYGIPNEHSDIDLCVVVDDGTFNNDNYGDVRFEVAQTMKFKYDLDLVMVERKVHAESQCYDGLVYNDIFNRGKRFYVSEVLQ